MGNINLGTVECAECGNSFTCRIGLSNRRIQQFSISCKECDSLSFIEVSDKQEIKKIGLNNSKKLPSYHIDLHLDFPVFEHESHPLISPFMMSNLMAGNSNILKHAYNIKSLNVISDNITDIKNTLNFYLKKKFKIFTRKTTEYLEIESPAIVVNKIHAEILLFKYIFEIIEPFSDSDEVNKSIDKYKKTIDNLSSNCSIGLEKFIKEIKNTSFIDININDTLKIYKQILEKEVIFRPSLFIDFDTSYEKNALPYRLSTKEFEYISDLFKDISEVLSRQLTIIAGINNLSKRGDHNVFKVVLSKRGKSLEPKSLKDFSNLDFGKKIEYIDSSWFPISDKIADNQLRNSTAHYKWEYDSSSQVIKYFPKKEGFERLESKEIYLIDYCKKVIDSFRIVHELNYLCHLVDLKVHKII